MDSVTIANMALGAIGQRKINSLLDDSFSAEQCNIFYEPAVKYTLEQKAWLFATEFIDLGAAQEAGAADPVFTKKFAVPGTVIAVRRVDDGSGLFDIKWERRGGFVFTEDTATLFAYVTQFIADPNLWTPTFGWAVAFKLAETICGPLTENEALEAKMERKFEKELAKAGTLDGLQGSSETIRVTHGGRTLSSRR